MFWRLWFCTVSPNFYLHVAKKTYHLKSNLLRLPWLWLESLSFAITYQVGTFKPNSLRGLTDQFARKVNIYQHLLEILVFLFWLQSSFAFKNTWFDYIKCPSLWTCVLWCFNFMGLLYLWLSMSLLLLPSLSPLFGAPVLNGLLWSFASARMICGEKIGEAAPSYWSVTYDQLSGNGWHCIWARLHHKFKKEQTQNMHIYAETAEIGMPRKGIRGTDD